MKLLRCFNEEKNIYEVIDDYDLKIYSYTLEELKKVLEKEKIRGCWYKNEELILKELIRAKRLLETNIANNGMEMTIVSFYTEADMTVRFEDGFEKDTNYRNFKNGNVTNPNVKKIVKKNKIDGRLAVEKHIGETKVANNGMEMTIIGYKNNKEVTIRFEDGYETVKAYECFKKGSVKNPNIYLNKYVGETRTANNGQLMTILDYKNYHNITVEFEDGFKRKTSYYCFKNGNVNNPYFKKK